MVKRLGRGEEVISVFFVIRMSLFEDGVFVMVVKGLVI